MKINSVLVTGANRGIGLEFVRQFSKIEDSPRFIFATYRNPESLEDLKKIQESSKEARVILIHMDVTVMEDIEVAKKVVEETVGELGLNLIINNAGLAEYLSFPQLTADHLEKHFKTNTVGPIMVLQTLFPLLEKAASYNSSGMTASRAAVINITSGAGSIQTTGVDHLVDLAVPGYKISKAALNMAMRTIAANVKDKGVLVVNVCPGWVKTDMGTDIAELEPKESIANMIDTISKLNETHHGSFINRLGKIIPF